LARVGITRISDQGAWPEGSVLAADSPVARITHADGRVSAHAAVAVDAALRARGVKALTTAAGIWG
jgi:hypothetical protein